MYRNKLASIKVAKYLIWPSKEACVLNGFLMMVLLVAPGLGTAQVQWPDSAAVAVEQREGTVSPSGGTLLPPRRAGRSTPPRHTPTPSVARLWNEELLAAIRRDTPRPTVHARNLFHVSAAMYDAWAAYEPGALTYFDHPLSPPPAQSEAVRRMAISYAAYRVLSHRFANSPGHAESQAAFDALMKRLGYSINHTQTHGQSPAAVGNRIAAKVLAETQNDGANEAGNYADTTGYQPVNPPLVVAEAGAGDVNDINRWQPLQVPGAAQPQTFLTPHWGEVTPFVLPRQGNGFPGLDPGPPPLWGGDGEEAFKADLLELIRASSHLDPSDGVMSNISPGVIGNNTLGTQNGTGYPLNPATGEPYPDNFVLRGDWGRVLAEFWADGPLSSTPPGHWNEIANDVSDHPALEKRLGGIGPRVSDLEWDVKLYFALNAALHDSAIATWWVKEKYDFGRPISFIRGMAAQGQSSNPALPSYHPQGLPLEGGVVELITEESSAPGERHAHLAGHLGEIALYAWAGHPADPAKEYGGSAWILGKHWLPYQQVNFVTPPFAGYTSGHSCFSRTAAEVLSLFTGSKYFPGGIGEYLVTTAEEGFALDFEFGPSEAVLLQWATYYDAADEAGLSRVYGGIHPALDDYPGRILGFDIGTQAYKKAIQYF
jgi:hypothetical protein